MIPGDGVIGSKMEEEITKNNNTKKLYLTALGMGVSGMAGVMYFIEAYIISMFHDWSRYPYYYPYSKSMFLACASVSIVLLVIWIRKLIKVDKKAYAVLASVGLAFIGAVVGMFGVYLIHMLGTRFT